MRNDLSLTLRAASAGMTASGLAVLTTTAVTGRLNMQCWAATVVLVLSLAVSLAAGAAGAAADAGRRRRS